jgi:hypothetical protein
MSEETMGLLIGLLGTIMAIALVGGAMVGAYLVGRSRGQREVEERARRSLNDPAMNEQIHRVEQLVADMSLEIERLAEAQRYNAKLLAEQQPPERPR